jgi:hypothetical protein
MDGETLREGIFGLNTRRFGTVAEVLIQRLGRREEPHPCVRCKRIFRSDERASP